MFSPNAADFTIAKPRRRAISDDDDDNDDDPVNQPNSLIRRLMFTTQNCITPGRALKRPRARSESVKVYLRIRPHDVQTIEVKDQESLSMKHPQTGIMNSYKFTRVFDRNTSQMKLFSDTTAPLIDSLFDGYNALIFAYGITNSGKTFSILGTQTEPGILPQTIKYLFNSIRQSNQPIDVYASYLEVHNDILIDLLPAESRSKPLSLIANKTGHVFVKGLREVKIEDVNDAELVVEEGTRHRKCAQTALNSASSRSHALFSLKLVRAGADKDTEGIISKLCIVDLAGAERTSRAKNADELRCRETNNINKSLMQLGRCLEVVRWNQAHPDCKARPAPWRDSKISRLFKDYLVGGWGRAVMIATVNPDPLDHDETCHALKFAALASEVESVSKVDHGQTLTASNDTIDGSEDNPDREEELLEEIYHLKLQLLDCERRRCATEADTRHAVCNELQVQAQKREAEFRSQLEEAEERARARAEKRFDIWKRNMISESDSAIDVQGVFDVANQKAAEEAERQLAKLRNQCGSNEVLIKQLEGKCTELQRQLKLVCDERDSETNAGKNHHEELKEVQSQADELMKKLEISLNELEERDAALEEQKRLNATSKQNLNTFKQQKAELEAAYKEAERRATDAEKKEASLKKRSEVNQNKANTLQKKITLLTSTIEKLEQELSEKTAAACDFVESMNTWESATSDLKSQLHAAWSRESQLSENLKELQHDIKGRIEKQTDLEKTISNLVNLSANQGDITSRLGQENDELQRKLVQDRAAHRQALEQNSQLQTEMDTLNSTLQRVQALRSNDDSELMAYKQKTDSLALAIEELQNANSDLTVNYSRLLEQLSICQQKLEKEISDLLVVKVENLKHQKTISSLQDALKEKQEQLDRLKELESTSADANEVKEENCLLKSQLTSLRKEKAREIKDMQKKINQLESASKKQGRKAENEKQSLEESLSDLRDSYQLSLNEAEEHKSALHTALTRVEGLESNIAALQLQLEASHASKNEAEGKPVKQLKTTIHDVTARLEVSKQESTQYYKEMDALKSTMQSEMDTLKSELDVQKRKAEELSSQLALITADKQSLQADTAAFDIEKDALRDNLQKLASQVEILQNDAAEIRNLEKENKQLQKKIASYEFQSNKKQRTTKQQTALNDRISQLEIEAAKYADAQVEIKELQQQLSEKSNEQSLKQLGIENETLRQRIQEFESSAKKRQQIEFQKQALERQLAQLESSNIHELPQESAVVGPEIADDISQSVYSYVKKPVLADKSNKKIEASRALKIVSAADQENVAAARSFGKRSRAILEENLKWSSILTSDPFDNIAKKATLSPEPRKKPARKQVKEAASKQVKEAASPKPTRRSTRSGR